MGRGGIEALPGHLEASYGIEVAGIEQLDLCTYCVAAAVTAARALAGFTSH
jgi:hypothetical protein